MPSLSLILPWAIVLLVLAAAVTLFARRSALGDSPWYWGAMFSMSAAAALFVMDGKYQRRQDHLENEYRYGTRSLATDGQAKSHADDLPNAVPAHVEEEAAGGPTSESPVPNLQSPASDRLISLWPLRIAAVAATLVSLGFLVFRGSHPSQ